MQHFLKILLQGPGGVFSSLVPPTSMRKEISFLGELGNYPTTFLVLASNADTILSSLGDLPYISYEEFALFFIGFDFDDGRWPNFDFDHLHLVSGAARRLGTHSLLCGILVTIQGKSPWRRGLGSSWRSLSVRSELWLLLLWFSRLTGQ